jgi:DGQHR domain-containing protein
MTDYIELPYIEVRQPIGSFYISSIGYKELLSISYADIRKINEEAREKDSFDSYLGIQRQVSPTRVKEIEAYVKTIDATFPTSVILHIRSKEEILEGKKVSAFDEEYIDLHKNEVIEYKNVWIDRDKHAMYIRKSEDVAQILDGQHRLEGLRRYETNQDLEKPSIEFDLNVTIFIDLDLDDQAQIFSVINKAQTKVNKSLVYDLYEYERYRSPQKTAHDVVRLLNRREDSPFYRKIKILGSAVDNERETIAQATFAEAVIKYISKEPMKDRDDLRRGGFLSKSKVDNLPKERYVFRPLFLQEKDEYIVMNLMNYFNAVSQRWPNAWQNKSEGNILNKSTGFLALMRLYKMIVNQVGIFEDTISQSVFMDYFNRIQLNDDNFNRVDFVPGSSGQSDLYNKMLSFIQ